MPLTIPVGSPPSEISDGRTWPKPAEEGPKALARPSVGGAPEAVDGLVVVVVVVVVPGVEDVVVDVPTPGTGTRVAWVLPPEVAVVAGWPGPFEQAAPVSPSRPPPTAPPPPPRHTR